MTLAVMPKSSPDQNLPTRRRRELHPKIQRPRKPLQGRRESVWDWLKARTPLRIQTSLGLKSSRLKPQPPHVFHYNRNFSLFWIDLLSRVPPSQIPPPPISTRNREPHTELHKPCHFERSKPMPLLFDSF